MTFRQLAEQHLYEHGMFEDQAKAVVCQAEGENAAMKGRWDDETEGYPDSIRVVLLMGVDTEALKWIDANVPKAWYRSMFEAAV